MEKKSEGLITSLREKAKNIVGPLVIGTAMSVTPISIDNNNNIIQHTNIVTAERELLEDNNEINIQNNFNYLLNSKIEVKNSDGSTSKIVNPLNIDQNDVNSYLLTKSDKDLKSFQVINNSKGKPTIILSTSIKSGIYEENKSIQSIKKAFDILNNADPNIVDKIASQYGVRAIAGELANTQMKKNGYNSTSIPDMGIICLNGNELQDDHVLHIFNILNQARYIYLHNYELQTQKNKTIAVDKKLHDNPILDKFIWTSNWIEKNKSKIGAPDYSDLSSYTKTTINRYRKYLNK